VTRARGRRILHARTLAKLAGDPLDHRPPLLDLGGAVRDANLVSSDRGEPSAHDRDEADQGGGRHHQFREGVPVFPPMKGSRKLPSGAVAFESHVASLIGVPTGDL
jgi:hypothetical protein